MLQITQDSRLTEVLERIKSLQIRFPIAEIEKRTGFNKGNISSILSGKKAMSDSFYKNFMKVFPDENAPIRKDNNGDMYKSISEIEERLIRAESIDTVLLVTIKELLETVNVLSNKILKKSFPVTPSKVDDVISKASKHTLDELRRKNK